MIIAIIILTYLFVVIFDFVPIVKSGKKKEYLVYLTFLMISFTVLILYNIGIKVPGPTGFIENSIKKLFGV